MDPTALHRPKSVQPKLSLLGNTCKAPESGSNVAFVKMTWTIIRAWSHSHLCIEMGAPCYPSLPTLLLCQETFPSPSPMSGLSLQVAGQPNETQGLEGALNPVAPANPTTLWTSLSKDEHTVLYTKGKEKESIRHPRDENSKPDTATAWLPS